jgi:hypothetical protein
VRYGSCAPDDLVSQTASALDGNVVHLPRKRRVAGQRQNEIIPMFMPIGLRHSDELVLSEGGKTCLKSRSHRGHVENLELDNTPFFLFVKLFLSFIDIILTRYSPTGWILHCNFRPDWLATREFASLSAGRDNCSGAAKVTGPACRRASALGTPPAKPFFRPD